MRWQETRTSREGAAIAEAMATVAQVAAKVVVVVRAAAAKKVAASLVVRAAARVVRLSRVGKDHLSHCHYRTSHCSPHLVLVVEVSMAGVAMAVVAMAVVTAAAEKAASRAGARAAAGVAPTPVDREEWSCCSRA